LEALDMADAETAHADSANIRLETAVL